jgi:hypothetical protein
MIAINSEAPTAGTVRASISTNQSGVIDMTSLAIADRTINVPFHGNSLFVVEHQGEAYTPMKPIVEGMGLDWKSQHKKLSQRFTKGMVEITIPSSGGSQNMICLALRKLAAWLNSISPNKVRAEIRDRVIQYQEECDDVLYEYWTKCEVTNPRKAKKCITGKITSDQQEAIKQLVMTRGKALPKEKQAKAMITMWSALKSHFGVSYKEIAEDQFTEALSLAARVSLEGQFIPREGSTGSFTIDGEQFNHPVSMPTIDATIAGFPVGTRCLLQVDETGTHLSPIDIKDKGLADIKAIRAIQRDAMLLSQALDEMKHRMMALSGEYSLDDLDKPLLQS